MAQVEYRQHSWRSVTSHFSTQHPSRGHSSQRSCFSAASGRVLGDPPPGEASWASESVLGSALPRLWRGAVSGGSWLLGSSSGSCLVFLTAFSCCAARKMWGLGSPRGASLLFLPRVWLQVLQPNPHLSPRDPSVGFPRPPVCSA